MHYNETWTDENQIAIFKCEKTHRVLIERGKLILSGAAVWVLSCFLQSASNNASWKWKCVPERATHGNVLLETGVHGRLGSFFLLHIRYLAKVLSKSWCFFHTSQKRTAERRDGAGEAMLCKPISHTQVCHITSSFTLLRSRPCILSSWREPQRLLTGDWKLSSTHYQQWHPSLLIFFRCAFQWQTTFKTYTVSALPQEWSNACSIPSKLVILYVAYLPYQKVMHSCIMHTVYVKTVQCTVSSEPANWTYMWTVWVFESICCCLFICFDGRKNAENCSWAIHILILNPEIVMVSEYHFRFSFCGGGEGGVPFVQVSGGESDWWCA